MPRRKNSAWMSRGVKISAPSLPPRPSSSSSSSPRSAPCRNIRVCQNGRTQSRASSRALGVQVAGPGSQPLRSCQARKASCLQRPIACRVTRRSLLSKAVSRTWPQPAKVSAKSHCRSDSMSQDVANYSLQRATPNPLAPRSSVGDGDPRGASPHHVFPLQPLPFFFLKMQRLRSWDGGDTPARSFPPPRKAAVLEAGEMAGRGHSRCCFGEGTQVLFGCWANARCPPPRSSTAVTLKAARVPLLPFPPKLSKPFLGMETPSAFPFRCPTACRRPDPSPQDLCLAAHPSGWAWDGSVHRTTAHYKAPFLPVQR